MNLDGLRGVVRMQTQTSLADLPDVTVDTYLQQAFERTINAETQWPFYEQIWSLTLPAGEAAITVPGDVNMAGVMALYDVGRNFRLRMIGHEYADDHFVGNQVGTLAPIWFSIWGDQFEMWPQVQTSDTPREYRLRGYRRPLVWLTPDQEPDCDARLHLALTHYAVALAYAQQEDEQLELTYMDRWQRDVELARRAIMEPRHQRPLVMPGSIDDRMAVGPTWALVPPS